LNDIILEQEIEYSQENAKVAYDEGNFPLAKQIYEKLWEDSERKSSFLLNHYGMSLRKNNESDVFVQLCDELSESGNFIFDKYVYSTQCRCIYDFIIKGYSDENKERFNDFITRAEYIKDHSNQMKADKQFFTPYVMTIEKVIKTYNERTSKNYREILRWLSYLNPDILSEEVYKFQDETGREREKASSKEFYYQHITKALEKTEEYKECIINCEMAFTQITKFHYRNDRWIKARMYYCKCMVDVDVESAIMEYKDLAYKENFWFMYHKLSQICFRYNKIQDALLYASKAYCCSFENEKMVNLLLDTAVLWKAEGNMDNAKPYFQASAYYRTRQAWSIPEELKYSIFIYELDSEKKPDINLLKRIAENYVSRVEGQKNKEEGKVKMIFPHGMTGFIKPKADGNDVYFNMKDVIKKPLTVGDSIEYELAKGNDDKIRAVRITKRG